MRSAEGKIYMKRMVLPSVSGGQSWCRRCWQFEYHNKSQRHNSGNATNGVGANQCVVKVAEDNKSNPIGLIRIALAQTLFKPVNRVKSALLSHYFGGYSLTGRQFHHPTLFETTPKANHLARECRYVDRIETNESNSNTSQLLRSWTKVATILYGPLAVYRAHEIYLSTHVQQFSLTLTSFISGNSSSYWWKYHPSRSPYQRLVTRPFEQGELSLVRVAILPRCPKDVLNIVYSSSQANLPHPPRRNDRLVLFGALPALIRQIFEAVDEKPPWCQCHRLES